jgi:hypothetical protein
MVVIVQFLADELEQHCLRVDRVYSKWAYEGILG